MDLSAVDQESVDRTTMKKFNADVLLINIFFVIDFYVVIVYMVYQIVY